MSTIKEKVIKETVLRIRKRLKIIDTVLNSTPLSDIVTLRQETYPKLAKMDLLSGKARDMVKNAADKEKRLFRLAKRQQRESMDMITEKVDLESELGDLRNELYRMGKCYKWTME